MSERAQLFLRDVELKGNEHKQLRPDTIYAKLYHENGDIYMSATLDAVLAAIRDRDLWVDGVTVRWQAARGEVCSTVILDAFRMKSNG